MLFKKKIKIVKEVDMVRCDHCGHETSANYLLEGWAYDENGHKCLRCQGLLKPKPIKKRVANGHYEYTSEHQIKWIIKRDNIEHYKFWAADSEDGKRSLREITKKQLIEKINLVVR